jgi:hypothetical protein
MAFPGAMASLDEAELRDAAEALYEAVVDDELLPPRHMTVSPEGQEIGIFSWEAPRAGVAFLGPE